MASGWVLHLAGSEVELRAPWRGPKAPACMCSAVAATAAAHNPASADALLPRRSCATTQTPTSSSCWWATRAICATCAPCRPRTPRCAGALLGRWQHAAGYLGQGELWRAQSAVAPSRQPVPWTAAHHSSPPAAAYLLNLCPSGLLRARGAVVHRDECAGGNQCGAGVPAHPDRDLPHRVQEGAGIRGRRPRGGERFAAVGCWLWAAMWGVGVQQRGSAGALPAGMPPPQLPPFPSAPSRRPAAAQPSR